MNFSNFQTIGDSLNAMYTDAADTLVNSSSVLSVLTSLLNKSIVAGDVLPELDPGDFPLKFTVAGVPWTCEVGVNPSTPSATDYCARFILYDDDGNVKQEVTPLYWNPTTRVVTRAASDPDWALLSERDFDVDQVLSDLIGCVDTSRVIMDAVQAIQDRQTSGLQAFFAKYSGPMSNISTQAKQVYSRIVDGFSRFNNSAAGVYQSLYDVYSSLKSATVEVKDNVSRLAFTNTDYYVQGYFNAYRTGQIIASAAGWLATIIGAFTSPIIAALGLAVSTVSSLYTSAKQALTSTNCLVDTNSLGNHYAQSMFEGEIGPYLVEAQADPTTITVHDVWNRARICGLASITVPGINMVISPRSMSDGDVNSSFRAEIYARCEIGTESAFEGVLYDKVSGQSGTLSSVYASNFRKLSGISSIAGAEEGAAPHWPVINTDWTNYVNYCNTLQSIPNIELDDDGNVTDTSDAYIRFSILQSVKHALLLSWCFTNEVEGDVAANMATQCALEANRAYVSDQNEMDIRAACSESNIAKLFNTLIANDVYMHYDGGIALNHVPDWVTITNYLFPFLKKYLYQSIGPNAPRSIMWIGQHCSNPKDVSYFQADPDRATCYVNFDFPDKLCPYVTPPKYSKGAFGRTLMIAAGVAAATAITAIVTVKLINSIRWWVHRKQILVERARYAFESEATNENWAAYKQAAKNFKWLALFTGKGRLSLITGWEVDSADAQGNTVAVLDAIRTMISPEDPSTPTPSGPITLDSIAKLIRGY